MNFTKKLLLSAALIIGFVAAGFAQTTTVGKAGDYEVWVSSDGTTIYTTTDSENALFGVMKQVGGELSDGKFILFLPNDEVGGNVTVYYTISNGVTFVQGQVEFTNGFANVSTIVKKYELEDFTAATQIAFAVNGKVYTLGNTGFLAAVNIMENYNPNPFGNTGSGNPFDKPTQTSNDWVEAYSVEDLNPFSLEDYIFVFLKDAQDQGIDVSHVYQGEITIKFDQYDKHIVENPSVIAYTDAMNRDSIVNIVVNPTAWLDASPAKRLAIIYHELGHDILNLEHKGEEGPLMSVYARADFSFEELFELRMEMFNDYKASL